MYLRVHKLMLRDIKEQLLTRDSHVSFFLCFGVYTGFGRENYALACPLF
jgi:hypothetical protein